MPKVTLIGAAVFARQLMTDILASSSPVRSVSAALMLDSLTAAVCSLEEIDRLFEEMWVAERESLTSF